ncbi:hypothetical protein pv_459 [Pithovirus sibericum]|uniref:Transmembrane protein n=1 Tax=Pithovirus sibericum TaxID=1450746 RepID=W5SB50_9VIRU|nr:hypothetical protein pv_459 [Pithovirus sibericum]AHH02025.1 hypothetical protein pv_459 [Pithovirus sibericum]WIL05114.1 hypothetical protein pmam_75 [Pithovirus mammoth]
MKVNLPKKEMSAIQIGALLFLSVVFIILITVIVYLFRRKVFCYNGINPWCWKDWTCPSVPVGEPERCPVANAQSQAQNCLPLPNGQPGCSYAWN